MNGRSQDPWKRYKKDKEKGKRYRNVRKSAD